MKTRSVLCQLLCACTVVLLVMLLRNGNLFVGDLCAPKDYLVNVERAEKLLESVHSVAHLASHESMKYDENTKVLILRHFHDSPSERETLSFFLKHGIRKTNFLARNVSVVIVCSGSAFPREDFQIDDSVIVIERENTGLDFGGYIEALSRLDWASSYDIIVFVNGTLLGPLFPMYRYGEDWLSHFTSLLSTYTRLAGITINLNIQKDRSMEPHVQSMLYVMERRTLENLRNWGVLVPVPASLSKDEIIVKYEVGISKALLQHGYNIASLLPLFQGVDFTKLLASESARQSMMKLSPNSQGDVWYQKGYFGGPLSPSDTLFVKENRFKWGANDILAAQMQLFDEMDH